MEEFTKKKRMNLSDFETTYSNDRKKQKTSFTNENNDYSNTINVQTGKAFSQRYYDILEKRKEKIFHQPERSSSLDYWTNYIGDNSQAEVNQLLQEIKQILIYYRTNVSSDLRSIH